MGDQPGQQSKPSHGDQRFAPRPLLDDRFLAVRDFFFLRDAIKPVGQAVDHQKVARDADQTLYERVVEIWLTVLPLGLFLFVFNRLFDLLVDRVQAREIDDRFGEPGQLGIPTFTMIFFRVVNIFAEVLRERIRQIEQGRNEAPARPP